MAEQYMQRLRIGCSFGPLDGGTSGTIGAFVDLPNGHVGCIVNAHTVLSIYNFFQSKGSTKTSNYNHVMVYQPAPALVHIVDNVPFGFVSSAVYKPGGEKSTGVAVALITITDPNRYPDSGQFPKISHGYTEEVQLNYDYGNILTNVPDNFRSSRVFKYGAVTGLTEGVFSLQGSALKRGTLNIRENCDLHNQIQICSMDPTKSIAKPGDAGALVMIANNGDMNDLRALGILLGGSLDCTAFYVTPIWEILKALELPLRLKAFANDLPMVEGSGNVPATPLAQLAITSHSTNVKDNTNLRRKALREMCQQHGKQSTQVMEACDEIRMQILAGSVKIKEVCATYRPEAPNEIVFVAYCESDVQLQMCPLVKNIDIKYQRIDKSSNKTKKGCAEVNRFPKKNEKDRINLTDILQKTSSQLLRNHSNLNIMTASPSKSRGNATSGHRVELEPCIVFYVRSKGYIPLKEDILPSTIGHYTTDVREGDFTLYNDPEKSLQQLKIGCSIGEDVSKSQFGGSWGTLGAFVELKHGNIGCITSAHVLLDNNRLFQCKNIKFDMLSSSAASTIYQPAPTLVPVPEKQPFGRIISIVYNTGGDGRTGVEVGLIEITDQQRFPDDGRFPKLHKDFTQENEPNLKSGSAIQDYKDIVERFCYKYGAKTGLTKGMFNLQGSAVKTNGPINVQPNCELHNQIEILSVEDSKPFAEHGDSGALVFIAQNNDFTDLHAIGILTGADNNNDRFYVTPIWEVLKSFEPPLRLKNFNQQIPMQLDENDENLTAMDAIKLIGDVRTTLEGDIHTLDKKISSVDTKVDSVATKVDTLGSNINSKLDALLQK